MAEALRVPLVFFGPGVEEMNLAGRWSQVDIAPTIVDLLGLSENMTWEGRLMPVKKSYGLRIVSAPGDVALYRGGVLVANSSAGAEHDFRGLSRGLYTIKAGGETLEVLVNGDLLVDLAQSGNAQVRDSTKNMNAKTMMGIILILAINLTGIAFIVRIARRG